jgi:hypothetical protein
VGAASFVIGRVTSPTPEVPAPPPAQTSVSRAPEPPEAPQFDLTEDPKFTVGVPLRPMDRDIFAEIVNMKLDRTRMRDVFPDRPYRVAFVGSVSERRIGVVLIDLDRDGKFDERWELKKGDVVRNVQQEPAAGETPVKYTLARGRWQVH